ncbi:BatD family protein [Xanthobacter sp. KR7-65]|uniref:BatD family protein n=1 Tax=Xanthobacter sp. KR7-65 TaxID=3156612 RepID=UPI0032B3126E
MTRLARPPRLMFATLLACALLLVATPLLAGPFKASIERLPMDQGDTFELVLSLTGRDSLEPPNVTPLTRDFDILQRAKRSRTETVAGRPVEVNEWVLTLSPKRAGRLTIPPLTLGTETSQPIDMDIAAGRAIEPPDDGPISMAVEVQASPPFYLQSEIPVVVRMFDRVGAMEANAEQPAADGATFAPDGQLRRYTRSFGRLRYRIVELRYIMRPQRAGTLLITPVALRATIPTSPPGQQEQARTLGRPAMPWLGGAFDAGRKITVLSNPVEVEVRPRPSGVTGWFLPARAVRLTEGWSKPPADARVGVALTRTLRLEVKGASPGQLPPLKAGEADGVRQYADEDRPQATQVEGGPGAVVETRVTVVPTRPGTLTLPAVSVPWWNVATNRAETATLPAVVLNVAPSADPAGAPAPAPVAAAPRTAAPAPAAAEEPGWPIRDVLAIGAVAALILTFITLSGRRGGRRPAERAATPERLAAPPSVRRRPPLRRAPAVPLDEKAAARAVEAACRQGDAKAAHRAFLAWNRAAGPGHAGTASARTPAMAAALDGVSHHLYAATGDRWDGSAFRAAFAAERKAARKPVARGARGLAPLYPRTR